MASDYGLNFGFRRSDESMAVREGRFKTPTSGAILLGSAVEIDPANAGRLKKSASNAVPLSGISGLLVQEENHIMDEVFGTSRHDSLDLGTGKLDQLSTIWSGKGTKVWFRNTDAYSRQGRTKDAVTLLDVSGLTVGNQLGWDGSKWVKVTGGITNAWLNVTLVSGSGATAYAEAVVNF